MIFKCLKDVMDVHDLSNLIDEPTWFKCNLCMLYVIHACFISIYTYDVYFICDMYFVFYHALARESIILVVLQHSCTFLHNILLHYWSYTSRRLMLFVVKRTWNKAYFILFYSKWENNSPADVITTSNKRRVADTLNLNTGISNFHNLAAFSKRWMFQKVIVT